VNLEKIFSKHTGELLHIVIRSLANTSAQRTNIISDDQFLQLAILNMSNGDTFKPHKHIFKNGPLSIVAQESWIVLRGNVNVTYYDVDDSIIEERMLGAHDVSITLKAGHNYRAMSDNTLVLEFKTGPYSGITNDKVFIGN